MITSANGPASSSHASHLEHSGLRKNCLTYLLPLEHPLSDRRDVKNLLLRKLRDRPLICEDVAALTYYEAGYFENAPPELNIRKGWKPQMPRMIDDLESRPVGFCFTADISLHRDFKLSSASTAWPCFLKSEITEVADPSNLIRLLPSAQHPAAAHKPPAGTIDDEQRRTEPTMDHSARIDGNDTEMLRAEVAALRRDCETQADMIRGLVENASMQSQRANNSSEPEAETSREEMNALKRKVGELETKIASLEQAQVGRIAWEEGQGRLHRAGYEDLRREIRQSVGAMEQKASAVKRKIAGKIHDLALRLAASEAAKRKYHAELSDVKSRVTALEREEA